MLPNVIDVFSRSSRLEILKLFFYRMRVYTTTGALLQR